jgi:hypothetical protein
MKYPCKTCLVKPACNMKKECREYQLFMSFLKDIVCPISVGISCILLTVAFFTIIIYFGDDQLYRFMFMTWVATALINIVISIIVGIQGGVFLSVLLAPMTVLYFIILAFAVKKYKRA